MSRNDSLTLVNQRKGYGKEERGGWRSSCSPSPPTPSACRSVYLSHAILSFHVLAWVKSVPRVEGGASFCALRWHSKWVRWKILRASGFGKECPWNNASASHRMLETGKMPKKTHCGHLAGDLVCLWATCPALYQNPALQTCWAQSKVRCTPCRHITSNTHLRKTCGSGRSMGPGEGCKTWHRLENCHGRNAQNRPQVSPCWLTAACGSRTLLDLLSHCSSSLIRTQQAGLIQNRACPWLT